MERGRGDKVFGYLELDLKRKGLVLRDRVIAELNFEFLGMRLEGDRGVLRHKGCRTWRLWLALPEVLRLGVCSGDAMRVLLGHLYHHFGLAPYCLSVLHLTYRFALEPLGVVAPLSYAERCEVRAARALLFVAQVDLWKGVADRFYCSDASSKDYALHESSISSRDAVELSRWREKWRVREIVHVIERRAEDIPAEPAVNGFEVAGHVTDQLAEFAADCRRPRAALLADPKRATEFVEVEDAVPALAAHIVHPARWCLIVAGAWRHAQRIHIHEARAAVMGLVRAVSANGAEDCIVISLGDNLAELLAQERGRASNRGLNALCRKAAAWQAISGVTWTRRYVNTKVNPSDHDSRRADRHELAPGETHIPSESERRRARRRAQEVIAALERLRAAAPSASRAVAAPPAADPPAPVEGHEAPAGAPRRFVLELGEENVALASALLKRGLDRGMPSAGQRAQLNVGDSRVRWEVERWLQEGRIWWLHVALPPTITRSRPDGHREGRIVRRRRRPLLSLSQLALNQGTRVSLYAPEGSDVWACPEAAAIARRSDCSVISVCLGCTGAPFGRRLRVCSNFSGASSLSVGCHSRTPHISAKGQVLVVDRRLLAEPAWVEVRSLANAFPAALSQSLVNLAASVAPVEAFLDRRPSSFRYVESTLAAALGSPVAGLRRARRAPVASWRGALAARGAEVAADRRHEGPGSDRRGRGAGYVVAAN